MKPHSRWKKFIDWVNGDLVPKDQTLFVLKRREPRPEPEPEERDRKERHRLKQFFNWYPLVAGVICAALVVVLIVTVLSMPPFGVATDPMNNEVARHYLEYTQEETGATNAVTGMILNYRGFDTLGESCVLFLAVTSVMMLLLRDNIPGDQLQDWIRREKEGAKLDPILQQSAKLVTPFIVLFSIYVLLNGETSPGGGFSGGTILGSGLVLFACAFGFSRLYVFLNRIIYDRIRVIGLMLYILLYGYYTFTGANHIKSPLLETLGGLILPVDVMVGLVVACAVYGFFALFIREEL